MSSGLNVQLSSQEPLYNELFVKLKKKLTAEIEEFDDSLPTYILQIAAMKSYPKETCLSNLEFLGAGKAQKTIDWLWELLETYRNGKREREASAPPQPKSVISRESIKEIAKSKEELKDTQLKGKRGAPEKDHSDSAPTERISKLLKKLNENKTQDPPEIEKSHPNMISLKKKNNDLRIRQGEAPAENRFKNNSQDPSASRDSKEKHTEKESSRERRKLEPESSEPQEKSTPEQEQSQSEQKPDQRDKKKIRCKNWPACKDESCPYVHPKEICKNFPNCKYGNRCLNIHPQTPCKFGSYCTRPDCAFTHPPRLMDMSMFPMQYPMYGGRPKNMQTRYRSFKAVSNEVAKPEEKQS